jgi:hypothetical protein
MNKIDEIKFLLDMLNDELGYIIQTTDIESLSPESCIDLAWETVKETFTEKLNKETLIGIVDKENTQFVIDDEFQIPLFGNELLLGDDDD